MDADLSPLRKYRDSREMTLADLAERLGVDKSTVQRWETGRVRIPADRIIDVERETGVSRADLRPDLFSPSSPESLSGGSVSSAPMGPPASFSGDGSLHPRPPPPRGRGDGAETQVSDKMEAAE